MTTSRIPTPSVSQKSEMLGTNTINQISRQAHPASSAVRNRRLAFTIEETCDLLGGISPRSLSRLEERGFLRSSKALRRKLYPLSELERFLNNTL